MTTPIETSNVQPAGEIAPAAMAGPVSGGAAEVPETPGPTPRLHVRRRVLKGALIVHNGFATALPCTVRDISEGGAQLRLDGTMFAPNHFELIIELDGTEADCDVVWRRGRDLGVRFRAAPRRGSRRRMQVVDTVRPPEKPKQKVQLRKPPRDADCW